MNKLYKYDHQFFASSSDVSDYWAGFIAADGYIHRGNVVRVAQKDKDHLEKFAQAVSTDSPVRLRKHGVYEICLYSPQMCHDLASRYKIVPAKSLILEGPDLRTENSCSSFIRGYTDGDGSIFLRRGCGEISWVCGSVSMLGWLQNRLDWFLPDTKGTLFKREGGWGLRYFGRQCYHIGDWLYGHSDNTTRLDRKYQSYQLIEQWYFDHPPHVPISSYIGVYRRKTGGWFSQISVFGRKIHLGEADSELEAARLWNDYVLTHQLERQLNYV